MGRSHVNDSASQPISGLDDVKLPSPEFYFGTKLGGKPYVFACTPYGAKVYKADDFENATDPDVAYYVQPTSCTCPGFVHHTYCKHLRCFQAVLGSYVALATLAAPHGPDVVMWFDNLELLARGMAVKPVGPAFRELKGNPS